MTKIDDIFKDKLSDNPIEKLDLEMSWNDFSKIKKHVPFWMTKAFWAIIGLFTTILLLFIFLKNYSTNDLQIENEGKQSPILKSQEKRDTVIPKENNINQEILNKAEPKQTNVTEKKLVKNAPSEKTIQKPEEDKNSFLEEVNREMQENPQATDNVIIDTIKVETKKIQPVIIVKNKTVAIQKTDTIINLEEKKNKR